MRSLLLLSLTAILSTACAATDETGAATTGGPPPPPPIPPFALPAKAHDDGAATPLEQANLEEIQRARANPPAEGERLVALPEVQSAIQQFGVDKQEVIDDFKGYPPVPPLAFDARLMVSARGHSLDMAENGFQEHDGTDGRQFFERIEDAGYQFSFCSENIFAYAESIPYAHAAFLIDWGVPALGHRLTTLDLDGEKIHIGISVVEDPPHPDVGPLVITQDLGMPLSDGERYLVGVVYRDADGDGAFDAGEGLEGLRVVPERGEAWDATAPGGGYTMPFEKGEGQIKVQVQSSEGVVLAEHQVVLEQDNVKLDFAL